MLASASHRLVDLILLDLDVYLLLLVPASFSVFL